ncbi:hypothetical protein MLD38_030141 [Melastoma candidum]|uniref:Uncharacterized protein n=1 Tax=Melastoma candidum TaxID=119954 RepID=A0ACB9MKZ1_9MYRT|nr:hypothetical protein MLD38_030141 [Melastoma candidum]
MLRRTARLLVLDQGGGRVPQGILALKERAMEEDEPLYNVAEIPDFCDVRGQVRVVFPLEVEVKSIHVRPYMRKENPSAISLVRKWSFLPAAATAGEITRCTSFHTVPAVLFSVGGSSGNYFHAFDDITTPLYATARSFKGEEVLFLASDMNPSWIRKFSKVFRNLSNYDIIDIDKEQGTLCFSRVIVGLRFHKDISTSSTGYQFTRARSYSSFSQTT